MADDADAYAAMQPDGRPKNIAANTVRHARALAEESGEGADPAAWLRLTAKAVDYTARYAATARKVRDQ
ncbi:hypothetical protein AB0D04_13755 [Streptomyces sp. NPDC048483]|uniref:hypothetical protein n=1 Tax=Streptomyces sp. NPDC048483 TaxID=3154927 RepID=UPI003440E80D